MFLKRRENVSNCLLLGRLLSEHICLGGNYIWEGLVSFILIYNKSNKMISNNTTSIKIIVWITRVLRYIFNVRNRTIWPQINHNSYQSSFYPCIWNQQCELKYFPPYFCCTSFELRKVLIKYENIKTVSLTFQQRYCSHVHTI